MSDTYRITIGGGVSPSVFASLDRFRTSITSVNGILGGLGTRLAAAFGGYQLGRLAVEAIRDADEMGKFAREVGIGVEQLSKLKYAADLAGAGDSFRTAMLKFSQVLADTTTEGSRAQKIFDAIGVSVLDATGKIRPTEQVLADVADKFASWEGGAQKAAIAAELFGTRNARLLVMLDEGAEGLRRMGEQAQKFGLVLTEETVKKAEAFNDAWETGQKILKAVALDIATALLPQITDLITSTQEATLQSEEWGRSLDSVKQGMKGVAAATVLTATAVADAIDRVATFARVAGSISASPLLKNLAFGPLTNLALDQVFPKVDTRGAGEAMGEAFTELDRLSKASAERWTNAMATTERLLSNNPAEVIAQAAGAPSGSKGAAPNVPKVGAAATASLADLAKVGAVFDVAMGKLDVARARLRSNFALTDSFKRREELKLMEEETATLDDQVRLLGEQLAAEKDLTAQEAYRKEIGKVEADRQKLSIRYEELKASPDPFSVGDQLTLAIKGLHEFNATAQVVARGFSSTMGSAVESLQQGFRGLIDGTKNWGDALNGIRMGILNGMTDAIARMFAEWVVGRAMAGMAHIAWTIREGTATTAALAPGALMASVSSYGAAAAIGAGALAAALAAMGTFKEGGFTGNGPSDRVAGLVHGREFVMPESVTSAWGLGSLEAIRSGAIIPSDLESREDMLAPNIVNNVPEPKVSVVWARTENEVRDIVESELFKGSVVKVVRNRRTESGIG